MTQANFGDKMVGCLRLAALPIGPGRDLVLERLSALHSGKAVLCKLDELCQRGYLECGTSTRSSWLTPKGEAALRASLSAACVFGEHVWLFGREFPQGQVVCACGARKPFQLQEVM